MDFQKQHQYINKVTFFSKNGKLTMVTISFVRGVFEVSLYQFFGQHKSNLLKFYSEYLEMVWLLHFSKFLRSKSDDFEMKTFQIKWLQWRIIVWKAYNVRKFFFPTVEVPSMELPFLVNKPNCRALKEWIWQLFEPMGHLVSRYFCGELYS